MSSAQAAMTQHALVGFRPAGSAVIASRMEMAFADRTWSVSSSDATAPGRGLCHAFFVTRGHAAISSDGGTRAEMTGPCVLWLPRTPAREFRLMAGSDGFNLSVPEDFVWRTAGESPLASLLRPMLGRSLIVAAVKFDAYMAELQVSFEALARESRGQEPGASVFIGLHLGVVLVHLWRACQSDIVLPYARGSGAATVPRFQQLIELHYRESLRIDKFASLLGVTRAHLHHACISVTGRTPLALIHDRLIKEATSKLKETRLPVEQVGYSLGFRDPSYFNRFFKRLTGQSPVAFRQIALAKRQPAPPTSFADWP
jgi:AraC family transcriptional regulator, transcriptional activator of pobA